jgi:hypothetical protein
MSTRKMVFGLVVCLSLGVFAQQLLSQVTRSSGFSNRSGSVPSQSTRPQRMPGQPDFERMNGMSPEEKMQYFQQLAEEQRKAMEEQEAAAMRQALGVNDEQWKIIEPRLKKVKHYRELAFIGTKPPFQSSFSSFGTGPGGSQGFSSGFAGGFQFQSGVNGSGGTFQSIPGRQDSEVPISPTAKYSAKRYKGCWVTHKRRRSRSAKNSIHCARKGKRPEDNGSQHSSSFERSWISASKQGWS